jgi:hypothetical protein
LNRHYPARVTEIVKYVCSHAIATQIVTGSYLPTFCTSYFCTFCLLYVSPCAAQLCHSISILFLSEQDCVSHVWEAHFCCNSRIHVQCKNSRLHFSYGPAICQLTGFTCYQRKQTEAMCQIISSRSSSSTNPLLTGRLAQKHQVSSIMYNASVWWAKHLLKNNLLGQTVFKIIICTP